MMQMDIESFAKDPDFVRDNDNGGKGELLDPTASEGETSAAVAAAAGSLEPYEGMEFESEEAARAFYTAYACHVGLRVRISRYTRSRRDNSIISRLIVCSKEGFRDPRRGGGGGGERKRERQRAATRVGCKAMLMVKKLPDGKWVVSRFVKEHNHGAVPAPIKLDVRVTLKEEEPNVASADGGEVREPFEGMEFDSEESARGFYINYAREMGFRARISKCCRSRKDNSIISRQIVCSKEGFREVRIKEEEDGDDGRVKRHRVVTRIGCKAMILVKKVNAGKWVVSRFEKEHNHALGTSKKDDAAVKGLVTHVGGDGVAMNGECCDGTVGTSGESLTVLYNRLCCEAIKFAQEGAESEEIYNVAMSALKEAVDKVSTAKRSAGAVAQGVRGGHGCCFTKCLDEAEKAVSGNNLVVMQQPVKFVLIPSTSLANDSKPTNHCIESPMVLDISNGQGIGIPNLISVLKQSSPTAQSVKGLGNGATEHMGAVQNSQKLDDTGVSQLKTRGGNGSSLASTAASEAQMVAFPALPVTLYMPVMGSLSESSSGSAGSNAYTLVSAPPVEASPLTTGTPSQVNVQQSTAPVKDRQDQTSWSYTGPNPQVHATAIAAGARIIPPQEATSLIKAIKARGRNSKAAFGSGCMQSSASLARSTLSCNSTEMGTKPQGVAHAHAEAIVGREQASSEEKRLHEPGEGLKEMDVAMIDHSAVYDGACDYHLFTEDTGS